MKNFIYLSIISLLFTACGSDDSDPTPKANVAPTIPALVSPADNKLCVDNSVSFKWDKATDANNDAITYQIQISKDNTFAQIDKNFEGADNSISLVLDKNTAYYWRIKANDNKGLASAYSTIYKFYTAGNAEINHLPFAPSLLHPILSSTLSTATASLKWEATDVDATDVLAYDVYFGTANPPTQKIAKNKTANALDVTLEPAKEYFWRVIVKDNKGGETVGQVWKFKTN
ncbi:SusE domain-containing protein [Flavobacterium sp. ALJ2]|uniref:SusE domain-containing protein n=1 Tax=Flavobacterium sp. ALJ2 TaxID=2786960 RepID=UPI00189ED2F5|nr:SusE domain-containing protein [Flavobacterium sp. ALJ2]MBF7092032.1 SusE domain-containing protein [Flavobacterium sp. ALJ2]